MNRWPVVMLALTALGWGFPMTIDADVERGSEALAGGDAKQALSHYRTALVEHGDRPAVRHNIGVALYRLAQAAQGGERTALLSQAAQAFRKAAEASDVTLRGPATYNLGNAMLLLGRRDEAIDAYKRALVMDPQNRGAKENLELALRRQQSDKSDGQKISSPSDGVSAGGQGAGETALEIGATGKLRALERLSRETWLDAVRNISHIRPPAGEVVDR